jgi:HSP20 family protein
MSTMVEPFAPWLRDLNRVFNSQPQASAFVPPADVLIDQDAVTVYMDVPGLGSDQLEIELENDMLSVRGERAYPYGPDQRAQIRRIERAFGRFERTLRVPRGLDPNAVEASLSNGVLNMRIPKPEQLKPHRIEVAAGDQGAQQIGMQGGGQQQQQQSPQGMGDQSAQRPDG